MVWSWARVLVLVLQHSSVTAPLNVAQRRPLLCFSTSRRIERSDRSQGLGGSSTRTSSGSLRPSSSSSKMKETKKEEEEEEEKGMESPRSGEKLKDEEVSEVKEVDEEKEEESVGKKLVTNGDAEGEEPRKAEVKDESAEVKQEVRNPHCRSPSW